MVVRTLTTETEMIELYIAANFLRCFSWR